MQFMKTIKAARYLPLLFLGLLLSACAMTLPIDVQPPSTDISAAGTNPLVGTAWQLIATGEGDLDAPVTANTQVTLAFDADGQVGGNAGCNTFGGSYTVDGETIQLGEIFSTLMACADVDVMELEQRYLDALNTANRFAIESDQLTIWYGNNDARLIFASADRPLAETTDTADGAATQTPPTPAATPAIPSDAEVAVTLERGLCFGSCPAYKVTIYTDGTVIFEGERFVDAMGTHSTTIEPEVVEQLVAGFAEAGYFGWEDEYTEMTVSDLPTITTSVTRDGETKQIVRYAGDSRAPQPLPYLELWIDLAAYTGQWTGASTSMADVGLMETPVMTLERTACFGMCPVYGLAIFADGTVIYLGVRHVEQPGVYMTTVEASEVEFLAMQMADSDYFNWEDEYTWQIVTDQPYAITTLAWQDQYKEITRYDGDPNAPVGLVRFEERIDQLVDVSQWVGATQ